MNGSLKKGPTRASYTPPQNFDLIVTEILGTVATSESMYEHTQAALPYTNVFGPGLGKVYIVPSKLTVAVGVYDFMAMDGIHQAARVAYDAVLPVSRRGDVSLMSTSDLRMGVWHLDPVLLGRKVVVREDVFALDEGGGKWRPKKLFGSFQKAASGVSVTSRTFAVVEWSAELWEGLVLENTMEAYKAMDARNAHARGEQWGFMFGRVLGDVDGEWEGGLEVKAKGWEKVRGDERKTAPIGKGAKAFRQSSDGPPLSTLASLGCVCLGCA